MHQDRDSLGKGTIPIPAAADALLLEVWPKQRVWAPPSSSFETQDQYSHPQLKVLAPFPLQIRFPLRFCFAGTELLIGFVLLIFQLLQIWAGSALPTHTGGLHGTPGTRTCLPASLHPLILTPAPAPPSWAQPGLALEGAGQPPPRQNNPHGQIMVISNLLGLCKSPLG